MGNKQSSEDLDTPAQRVTSSRYAADESPSCRGSSVRSFGSALSSSFSFRRGRRERSASSSSSYSNSHNQSSRLSGSGNLTLPLQMLEQQTLPAAAEVATAPHRFPVTVETPPRRARAESAGPSPQAVLATWEGRPIAPLRTLSLGRSSCARLSTSSSGSSALTEVSRRVDSLGSGDCFTASHHRSDPEPEPDILPLLPHDPVAAEREAFERLLVRLITCACRVPCVFGGASLRVARCALV